MVDEDVRLMLAFRDGDERAFDALFERWAGRVLRFPERMVDEASVAEDLVQETFVRVFRARERYSPDARLERMQGRLEAGPGASERMSPESREKLAPLVRRWRSMPPDERHRMRRRLERLRTLAPEDQQALIEKKFESRSPAERARILESLREASSALPPRPLLDAPEPSTAPD